MKKYCLLLCVFLLAACSSPSTTVEPAIVETAIAQTIQAGVEATIAQASDTPTPPPTDTPTPTPTATQTANPTETPSPTPDLRVIDMNPYDLMLTVKDLPADAKYVLPGPGWISPHRNSEVVSGWGVEEGRDYIEKTGRVDGWFVYYFRNTKVVIAPEEMYDNIVMYRTAAGAQLIIDQYSSCKDRDSDFTLVETDFKIGDASNVCIRRQMQPSGDYRVWYRIEFSYRNYYHAVHGYGWEKEVRPEYVQQAAVTLLEKLKAAPLSDEVLFTP